MPRISQVEPRPGAAAQHDHAAARRRATPDRIAARARLVPPANAGWRRRAGALHESRLSPRKLSACFGEESEEWRLASARRTVEDEHSRTRHCVPSLDLRPQYG